MVDTLRESSSDIHQSSSQTQEVLKTKTITMIKFFVFSCVIAAAVAGILSPAVGIASSPAVISVPTANIVRTVPVALGATITVPATQIVSKGLVSGGIISNGLVSGGLVSGGLINGGLVTSGKLLSGGLVTSGKLI